MEIKHILKNRRLELGLSQADVAKAVGVSEATVSRWESGNISNMGRSKIASLSKVLSLSPGIIAGYEEPDSTEIPVTGMIPIVGLIPAGVPVLATENIEGYMPTIVRNPEEYFALRVHGVSMINAGIPDHSLVLIHKQPCAEDGQIVACRVNGDEATLKRFKQVKDTVVLMPENPDFQPIIVTGSDFERGYAEIIGIVKQIIIDV